jgi:hypothetical protein
MLFYLYSKGKDFISTLGKCYAVIMVTFVGSIQILYQVLLHKPETTEWTTYISKKEKEWTTYIQE